MPNYFDDEDLENDTTLIRDILRSATAMVEHGELDRAIWRLLDAAVLCAEAHGVDRCKKEGVIGIASPTGRGGKLSISKREVL